MPELPEVESVKRSLAQVLPNGVRWTEVITTRKDLRVPFPKDLKKLVGSELIGLDRRSKYLIFKRREKDLLSHLGMSGTWRELKKDEPLKLHDHVVFGFSNGVRLAYNDPRRFGVMDWGGDESPWLKALGPEPLTDDFTAEYLLSKLKNKKSAIKVLLMNPQVVVGVGNIYASEVLFLSGIRPAKLGFKITKAEAQRIVLFTQKVLLKAIKAKGSTLKDYKMVNGESGKFQNLFNVYGRSGLKCKICEALIKSKVLGQRSTYWCAKCQK